MRQKIQIGVSDCVLSCYRIDLSIYCANWYYHLNL